MGQSEVKCLCAQYLASGQDIAAALRMFAGITATTGIVILVLRRARIVHVTTAVALFDLRELGVIVVNAAVLG